MSKMSPKIFVSREAVRPTQTSGELSIGKMYPVLKKKQTKNYVAGFVVLRMITL